MKEEWKEIKGYSNYLVSNLGNIFSFNSKKILKQRTGTNGYLAINLYENKKVKTFSVHRLVAFAFLEKPNPKEEVNHIDGNKKNNSVENLEWVTRSENIQHAYNIGLKRSTERIRKKSQAVHGHPVTVLIKDSKKVLTFPSMSNASFYFGLHRNYFAQLVKRFNGENEKFKVNN